MHRRTFGKLSLTGLTMLPSCSERRPITSSLSDQAESIRQGHFTAAELTQHYLDRIALIDPQINAVIELNPEALDIARALDSSSKPRGPLHGIPIVIKDNIETADRMHTTAGSLALLDSKPKADAALVTQLRDAGAIILGKTNLSEWANMRSTKSTSGWSARGGLTKNPHVLDHNPSGSSSGSAAAVAANLCAAAIGTETDGSIVSPASACGIVGLKPTLGLISGAGIIPITHWQDTAGPMARSVHDCALLLNAVSIRNHDYTGDLTQTGLKGLRLGFLRHMNGDNEAIQKLTETALDVLCALGAEIIEVELPHTREIAEHRFRAMLGEYREDLNSYLASTTSQVRSIEDLIAFNKAHRDQELPHFGQELLEMAAALNSPEAIAETKIARKTARRLARYEGIDSILGKHRLNAFVVSTSDPADKTDLVNGNDGRGCSTVPATAGYPHITLPMGSVGPLPANISFFGTVLSEPLLFRIAHAYEQAAQHRMEPKFLTAL